MINERYRAANAVTAIMATVTVRNLPDEVHRALQVQVATRDRSTEAEIRDILGKSVLPGERLKLGSLLASIARESGGLADADQFDQVRDQTPVEPMRLRVRRFLEECIAGSADPRTIGTRLVGDGGIWRYRVGDYRLLCQIKDGALTVLVVVAHHREVSRCSG